ncbi:MAG: RibD family protein [Leptospirales bacterium]
MAHSKKKTKVTLRINMAQSMDGHTIEPDGRWSLGSKEDKRRMDRLRLWADCLIASRRSIENDNPNLIARSKINSKRHPMPVIILQDTNRKIRCDRRVFKKPHPPGEFWVNAKSAPSLQEILEEEGFKKSVHGEWKVRNWQNVTDIHNSLVENGNSKILLEGGPTLNGLFLKENLIDEVFFTMLPCLWAGKTSDRIITSKDFLPMTRFKVLSIEKRNNEVFFRYKANRKK